MTKLQDLIKEVERLIAEREKYRHSDPIKFYRFDFALFKIKQTVEADDELIDLFCKIEVPREYQERIAILLLHRQTLKKLLKVK